MSTDPRLGDGCGFVSLPMRKCEVCGEVGVMRDTLLNDTDVMVLCGNDRDMVIALMEAGVVLGMRKEVPRG